MTMRRAIGLLILAVCTCLTNGCSFGMTARRYPVAQGPKGVIMTLGTSQGKISGELIEVRDSGIVVLADRKLRLLLYTAILSSQIDQTSSRYAIAHQTAPKPNVQAHLKLLSRFPQGLTPELMRQLMEASGQTELAGANP